ncbi:MAG: DUF2203 family protein [Proteobacteria bacterium]|nr:DUF2203 family protein [Pseudomonadota bacterium]
MHELRKYFDLVEAEGMIPELEHLFAELAKIQLKVNDLCRAAEAAGVRIDVEDAIEGRLDCGCRALPAIGARIKELSEEYLDILDDIADTGAVLCDVDLGMVGFHTWFFGREIMLSWQYGEPAIGHWHGLAEDPFERRSLDLLFAQRPGSVSLH